MPIQFRIAAALIAQHPELGLANAWQWTTGEAIEKGSARFREVGWSVLQSLYLRATLQSEKQPTRRDCRAAILTRAEL